MDKKDEYTKVPNMIYDALLKYPLSIAQIKTAFFIIRKTYGWNKTSDHISYSQIEKGAGITRRAAIYAVKKLCDMGIISVKKSSAVKNEMQVLYPDKWMQLVNSGSLVKSELVNSGSPKLVNGRAPTKEKKETRLPPEGGYALEDEKVPTDEERYCDYDELLRMVKEGGN